MSRRPTEGFWPGERHSTLLHAALDEDEPAVASWRRWREQVDFDDVDMPEQRLLPLVYRNLGAAIREDPVFGRAAGLYRRAWTQNQLLFSRVAGALEALRGAGLEALLLKGAPLSILHYGSSGARPMADVDVLVRPFEAERAMGVLRGAGWRPEAEPAEAQIRVHHGYAFSDGGPGVVDLHWFSLWQSSSDGPMWEVARPFELGGVPALAPSPADLLLIVCAHGSPRQPEPAFRWVADAVTVCRTSEVDWDRLSAEARRRNLRVAAAAALDYLRTEFGVEVPDEVFGSLNPGRAPRWERAAFLAQGSSAGPFRTLRLLRERHRRMRMLGGEAPWHPGFPTYAASIWGFERPWQLPAYAARRTARHLALRLSPRRRAGLIDG
jgi:hypothetical protein